MSDSTIIVKAAPLKSAELLRRAAEDSPTVRIITLAYPSEIAEAERRDKAVRLLLQAAIYIQASPEELQGKLLACSQQSILDSLSTCAAYDLEIHRTSNEAHLVPFKGVCTLMIGYEGIIKLMMKTGAVASVYAELIYRGEPYRIVGGAEPNIEHEIKLEARKGDDAIIGAYGVSRHFVGPPAIAILTRAEIDRARAASKAKTGPWNYWFSAMAIKTALLRLKKFIPKTGKPVETRRLIEAIEHEHKQFGLADDPKYAAEVAAHAAQAQAMTGKELTAGNDDPARPVTAAEKNELMAEVWRAVQAAGGPTDMAKELIVRAVRAALGLAADAAPKIGTLAELGKVREELKHYDMATGDRIPD